MKATIIKKHSRHSKKCDAGYRRSHVETSTFWVSHLSGRTENGNGISAMLIGDYEIEMDETTIVALHARLGDFIADFYACRKVTEARAACHRHPHLPPAK